MNKKNLLIVTSTFPRWENDTDPPFVFELAKRLTNNFNITVLTPNYLGALPYENMEGINVHRFRYFLKGSEKLAGSEGILPTLKRNKLYYLLVPFFILAELLALLQLIRKNKPDIIHAHWILPQGFVAALAHRITGVPFVLTTHGADIYGLQGQFASNLKRYALKKASIVTVVSKNIQKFIEQNFGEQIQTKIIPMGVDSTLFHPDRFDPEMREKLNITGPFLLYVGRLSEKKGVTYLLQAMPLLLEHFPDSKLLIVGTGELKHELRNQAESLNLIKAGKVVFTGAVPNNELPSYFASADIFIGPSIKAEGGDTEGFGLTFVEAAMCGCIVVGTNVGGISDIVEDGKTGFLVPEKSPQTIAKALIRILQDPSKINAMKNHAREKMIQQFDWRAIADQYAEILKDNTIK
jgi:glycosyltransferase involved in cell wall biosynthesis